MELLGRVVDKVKPHPREIRVCMHRTAGSPRQHVRTEEKPRGVLSRSRLRTSSGWASSPAARSHSEGTAGSVCRLSRVWRESINACHFRRASAWHYTAPTVTLPLGVFRAMQGSSCTERLIGRGNIAPTTFAEP